MRRSIFVTWIFDFILDFFSRESVLHRRVPDGNSADGLDVWSGGHVLSVRVSDFILGF